MYNFGQIHRAMNKSDLPFYLLEWALYHSGIIHTCNISLVYDLMLTLQCHMIRYDYARGLIIRMAALDRFTVLNYWCIIANCLVINFTWVINMNRDNRVFVHYVHWVGDCSCTILLCCCQRCWLLLIYKICCYLACKVQHLDNNIVISKDLLGFLSSSISLLELVYDVWFLVMYNWSARALFQSTYPLPASTNGTWYLLLLP